MQIARGVPTSPSQLDIQSTVASTLDPGGMFTTVSSVVLGSSNVGSVVPYDRSSMTTPPYNSSAMYKDSALPVYVIILVTSCRSWTDSPLLQIGPQLHIH